MRKILVLVMLFNCCWLVEARPVKKELRSVKPLEAPIQQPTAVKKTLGVYEDERIGIGFNSQLSNLNLNSLSVRYWMMDGLGVEGLSGFNFASTTTLFDLGVKIMKKIKKEENMYLYLGGLTGLEYEDSDSTDSNINWTIGALAGGEFFFKELPNLGFGLELGLKYKNVGDDGSFGTGADFFNVVGVHYYFDYLGL